MATRQTNDAMQVPPGSILLVVHDFIARSPDELSLAKGDRIELIERDDDFGDGWFLGRHMTNGSTGLFPEVYTTPAPKATLPISSNQQRGARLSPASPPFAANPIPDNAALTPLSHHVSSNASSMADGGVQRPGSSSSTQTSQTPLRSTPLANMQHSRNLSQGTTHNSVMHETLSVIDEHITDLRTPRATHSNSTTARNNHDADSVYSSHTGNRLSYINGHETDEEEGHAHTEAEVMAWTPARVAEYLQDQGIDKEHCDFFRDQEMSGEVLLHMEQSTMFIKDFDLGTLGRRLKTWQKVKALQEEVRSTAPPTVPRSVSDYSAAGDDHPTDVARIRSNSRNDSIGASALPPPRPSTAVPASSSYSPFPDRNSHLRHSSNEHLQSFSSATGRPENNMRPSAASVRSLNHSRRHSSVGSLDTPPQPSTRFSHQRQPSASALATASAAAASAAARRRSSAQERRISAAPSYSEAPSLGTFAFGNPSSPADLDRGYFSGNEVDNRNKRNVLHKKSSPSHSRNPSAATDSARHSAIFRHGRMPSAESVREPVSPLMSPASANFPFAQTTANRAVSSPQVAGKPLNLLQGPSSPIVTKLEYGQSIADSDTSSVNPSPSPASHNFSFFSKPRMAIGGLRIASDAVTQNEKRAQSGLKNSPITSPTRTGSTTPSTDTRSFDLQKQDPNSRVSTGSSSALAPPPSSATARNRPKARTKKTTSAYTRGLEKKPPAEQMDGCDYSGWMKKKSSNLMGSWKPRLFVLRGRRLSYYYTEGDTEEKGLIDISSHRVLPAENERMTGIHAALTGASSPVVPLSATNPTSAATDLAAKPVDGTDQGLFIFKLVPPRQGLSKAVNFTKPAVHYFAVNSRQEGRLWMAALMKATIDYDPSGKLVTSYNQKTISLAKARARNERPPALKEVTDEQDEEKPFVAELDGASVDDSAPTGENAGLGIGLDATNGGDEQTVLAGAEREDTGPVAPRVE